jgi:succinate dehydrogenase / fumarate reductase cytochrome b subunit
MAQTITRSRGPVSGTASGKGGRRKPFLVDFYSTALGKKYVMAITGIIGIGFVISHMIGNLKAYIGTVSENGQEVYDIDIYGEYLRELLVPLLPHGVFLWIMRIVLLGAVVLHVHAAYSLTVMNRTARPIKYQSDRDYQIANFASRTMRWTGIIVLLGAVVLHVHAAYSLTVMNRAARPIKYQSDRDYQVANFASRTMRWTGIIVLLFILWHLADLTWGWANPDFEHGMVYRNLDASLSRVPVAILYIVANIALGIHLFHGTWSLFQSIGWNNPRFNQWRKSIAAGVATLIVVGNVSFPIMTLAGVIEFDPDVTTVHDLREMEELDVPTPTEADA